MTGYDLWSYSPYKPILWDTGDIYICRVAPGADFIHFEWLDSGASCYNVFCRPRGSETFRFCGSTDSTTYDITHLQTDVDYEFYVSAGDTKSRIRLAKCAPSVGTVVNYLHPEDEAYAFSGRSLCSPSMVRHPDGYLLSSMDVFAGKHPQNLTLIFRSDDDGQTWHYVSELMPCFWGKLFIHKNELYMLATSTEYGDLLIGKSTDGGKTFCAPVTLLRGSNGKNGNCGVHRYPQNHMYYQGRLFEPLEWGCWANTDYYHAAMMMSCDENADLLDPKSWHFTAPVKFDPNWDGLAKGISKGTIEGTLCVDPQGQLRSIMRYNITQGAPAYGLVLNYRVNTQDPDAPLEYSHAVNLPGNNSKFIIRFDPVSKNYYTIISRIYSEEKIHARNLLSLMVSPDLENWTLVKDLIDARDEDHTLVGFQYVFFEIEGDDILFLCRTSMNGARNYHDANYQTFHRIRNFRDL